MFGKGKGYAILSLIIGVMFFGTHATESSIKVSSSLDTISTTMAVVGIDVQPTIDELNRLLEAESGTPNGVAVSSSIEEVSKSIKSYTGKNTVTAITSALAIMTSVTRILPLKGPLIGGVCMLFSAILGAISGKEGTGTVVKKAINEALNQYDESELKSEAAGLERVFRTSQAYLNAGVGEGTQYIPQGHELSALIANVPIHTGIQFLGKLQSKIMEAAKKKNVEQGKRAIIYTNLYVRLAILRSITYFQMQTVVKATGNSDFTANAIKRVTDLEEENDKNFIKFLTQPTYETAYMFTQLFPSKETLLSKFLSKHGLKFQNLAKLRQNVHLFSTMQTPFNFMSMSDTSEGWLYGNQDIDEKGTFQLKRTTSSDEDGVFTMIPLEWPTWYVYMSDNKGGPVRGWKTDPGRQGYWKMIQCEDGNYLISCLEWPDWYIYMTENVDFTKTEVRGWQGIPDDRGRWNIN